ncbi:SGNH/GDSL hydrolase family protein [Paramagnetospirillum kuznetsovii]|nr:GDSL-type esterase/lipase family protein [Paramagnetospirillum kuznetsovii]
MTSLPIRRWAKIAAFNLGLLLAVAVAAELVFGAWLSSDPLDRIALPRDTRLTVSAKGLYPHGDTFTYRRNHWGFRGAELDPAKVDLVTLGGSTTNQMYLPEDQTWQAVLTDAFRQAGRPMVIANAGIDGQSSVGHLVALESWLAHVPGLKPKLVLAYVGLNDVHVGGNVVDQLKHSSRYKWFTQNSALFRLWQSALGALNARKARLNHESFDFASAVWTTQAAEPPESDLAPTDYARRLRLMAEKIRALGAEPIFVTQPRGDWRFRDGRGEGIVTPAGPNGVDQHRRLAAHNAAAMAVCGELRMTCLDMGSQWIFAEGDFYDVAHNTPQGAAKIGSMIFEGLKDHPLLGR